MIITLCGVTGDLVGARKAPINNATLIQERFVVNELERESEAPHILEVEIRIQSGSPEAKPCRTIINNIDYELMGHRTDGDTATLYFCQVMQ